MIVIRFALPRFPSTFDRVVENPLRTAWCVGYGLMLVAPLFLFVRRLSVDFEPLAPIVFVASSAFAVAASVLVVRVGKHLLPVSGRKGEWILATLTFTCLAFLTAISLRDSHPIGLILGWSLAISVHTHLWTVQIFRLPSRASSHQATSDADDRESTEETDIEEASAESWPPEMTQQLTRLRQNAGETLLGGLRVDFAPGERQRAAHLAFCPPFKSPPECHFEQTEGPAAKIEITSAEPYGLRFEVRLQDLPANPETVVVQFEATTTS